MRIFKRSKILATIGPATHSYESVENLMLAGVNGFRINFSHGKTEERLEQAEWIRKASKKLNKPVAIFQDLHGPKVQLGDFDGEIHVKAGDQLHLVYGHKGNPQEKLLPILYDLSRKAQPGERLYIFDGRIKSKITAVHSESHALTVQIENEGRIIRHKGLNLPDTDFSGDILTEKDLKDIQFGATQDYDFVNLSFVQRASDVELFRAKLLELGSTAKIVSKIETKSAIEDDELENIVLASDGVMVARGDLAAEVSSEVVPIVQRKIIGLCQKYNKISIVATQMMVSMVEDPEPTRAEVNDIATAVILGSDCLMLSEETAIGKYPVEAVSAMKRVILYTQEHAPLRPVYYREGATDWQDAISSAAITLAHQVNASAIVCETKTGRTALSIAAHRPNMPIITVTSNTRVAQQLTMLYANKSYLRPEGEHAGFTQAKELREQGYFEPNSTVVLVSGRQPGLTGGTDTIRVRVLE